MKAAVTAIEKQIAEASLHMQERDAMQSSCEVDLLALDLWVNEDASLTRNQALGVARQFIATHKKNQSGMSNAEFIQLAIFINSCH